MSEADRVFPRHKRQQPHFAAGEKRHILSAPRRGSFERGKSRVVEVVHVRRDKATLAEPCLRPVPWNVRAETWPEGFRAQSMLPTTRNDGPMAAAEPAEPTVHVMAMWEPTLQLQPSTAEPVEQPAEPLLAEARQPRNSGPSAPKRSARRFANPFADDDNGANCIRCGYLVEQTREKRGLWTCSSCA